MKTVNSTDLLAITRGHDTHKVVFSDLNQLVSHGTTPPASPKSGALWFNTNKGVLYSFNGTVWIGN